jgi:uncharacterized protein (DUF342 family)
VIVPDSPTPSKTLFDRDGVQIRTDEDKLAAFLSYQPGTALPSLTVDKIKQVLKTTGIMFGLDEEAIARAAAAKGPVANLVIARGKEKREGTPPRLDYKFPVDRVGAIGKQNEAGRIDFREKGKLPYVKVGEVVALLIPGTDPVSGRRVTGEEIKASVQLASGLEPGIGVEQQGERYIAKISGAPRLDPQGRVEVTEVWTVEGDVDNRTGNLRFDGPVKIKGIINPGFEVEAKSIHCEGIEKHTIVKAHEDIIVDGGIIGGKVTAGGNISARFFNCAQVTCIGDIDVKLSIINSEVNTSGKIKAQTIIGGNVATLNGLECVNLSSEASRATVIFGVDPIKQQQVKELVTKKVDIEGQIAKLQEELAPLYELREQQNLIKKEIENLNSERVSITQRRSQVAPDDKNALEFFDGRIGELKGQIAELENKIRELNRQMVALGNFSQQEKELTKLGGSLESLDKHYSTLISALESVKVSPTVAVKGTVKRGTRLSGVHAQLVLRQEMRRVLFRERKMTDAELAERRTTDSLYAGRRVKWFIDKERL